MPAPGDQHRETPASVNPFEDSIPRINEYTAQEIATLQSRLDKQLGPEYISWRPGAGGGKVPYVAADKVINLANEVFGFNGWSSQIRNVQIDFFDENPNTGKISLGLSTTVRVTLKDGTFHEDIGYGSIENCKGKAPAFEKAKKEAATDALKRALRTFGNVLGNCLYDKDFVARIAKVKTAPSKWDADNLHRHPDFAPPKTEEEHRPAAVTNGQVESSTSMDFDDEFGTDLLGEVEINSLHPEETMLPPSRPYTPKTASSRNSSVPTAQLAAGHPGVVNQSAVNASSANSAKTLQTGPDRQKISVQPPNSGPYNANLPNQRNSMQDPSSLPTPQQQPQRLQQSHTHEPPVGFITSRAAEALTGQNQPVAHLADLPRFNPNAESPSIRKTNGINHSTSAPVSKSVLNGGATSGQVLPPSGHSSGPNQVGPTPKPIPTNFVNPADSVQRKIGAPSTGSASPLANRSAYKPPSVVQSGTKRPLTPSGAEENATNRQPLMDVSNVSGQPLAGISNEIGSEDAKRPKMADA